MNFWRAILASLLSLMCTIAVSGYVTLQTLDSTVLNRNEVKGWLDKSGVYNNLLSNVISGQNQTGADNAAVSTDALKSSLSQTFTPTYVQQATEKTIDGAYDWLSGTASTINFNIDATTKRDDFIASLSSALEPKLAALPRCTSPSQFNANNPTCLPPGTTSQQAASALATDAANQADIFQKPVDAQTVAQGSNASFTDTQNAQQIRSLVSDLHQWLIWLPVIAITSGGLVVLLSPHRFKAAKYLAGRLTVGLAMTCAIGLLVANIGSSISLRSYAGDANGSLITGVVEPIIHQAAPAIGGRLALVSGSIAIATFATWITLLVIKKRRDKTELLKAPAEIKSVPTFDQRSAADTAKTDQSPTTKAQSDKK